MLRRLLVILFVLLGTCQLSRATHIVGGDLTYRYLGNNNYRIQLYLYVDCVNGSPAAIDQDRDAEIGVFNSGNFLVQSLKMVRTGPQRIIGKNYSCVEPPPNACVDLYIFETTATLPPVSGGYQLVFQRCCRNNTISNLNSPNITGATYRTFIPDAIANGTNTSAKFNDLPPNFLCTNEPLEFNHSATDADGDSLVYTLCNPLHGASSGDPIPIPVNPPPYSAVSWRTPYNIGNQMGGNPAITLDPVSGLLQVTPNMVGQFVVGICVDEYRNGRKINTVLRDFQFNVVACNFEVKANFSVPIAPCSDAVSFVNNSSGGPVAYRWDFGVAGRTDDTSVVQTPNFNYPGPGTYEVTLEAINNKGCVSKFKRTVHILAPIDSELLPDSTVCLGTSINIGTNNSQTAGVTWMWSPATDLSSTVVPNPVATVKADRTYTARKTSVSCYVEGAVNVSYDRIKADWTHVYLPPCDGLKVMYSNASSGHTRQEWDFGDPRTIMDRSTEDGFTWYYQDTGIMYVKLKVSNEHCSDSITKPIRIIFPDVFTTVIDTAICLGQSVRIGPANDTSILSFTWTPTEFLSNGNTLYPLASPNKTMSYVLLKQYQHCTRRDSFIVEVNEIPDFRIERSRMDDLCPGDSVFMGSPGNYRFEWFPKDGVRTPFSGQTWVVPPRTTLYRLVATTSANCSDEDTVTIPLYPLHELDLAPDYTVCRGTVFLPDIDIPDARIIWTRIGNELVLDSLREEGKYKVRVSTKCQVLEDTIQLAHYVPQYCAIELPNAFTPNVDRVNETYPFGGNYHEIFGPECDFTEYNLIIFNRWGEIVFRSETPGEEWDGHYKNNDGNIEVYGYYLQYREYNWCTGSLELKVKRGNITVLR